MTETQAPHGFDRLLDIWSRRKLVAALTFSAALAIGVGVVMGLPNMYRASATLLVQPSADTAGEREPAEVERRLQVINEELLSRSRLAEVARRFRLYEGSGRRAPTEEDLVDRMRRDIKTEVRKADEAGSGGAQTRAFVLSYQGRDPATVAQVANTLASWYLEKDAKIDAGAVQSLGEQVQEAKRRLQEQEKRLAQFQEQHRGELPQQVEVNMAALQRIDARLQLVTEGRMQALERRAALAKQIGDASSAAAAAPSDPNSSAGRLAKMKGDLADMQQRYTDAYPDVARLKDEIARLEARPPDPGARRGPDPVASLQDSLRETDSEVARLSREEEALRGEAAGYNSRIEASPRRGQAYQEVARDYETTKTLYGTLLKSYEEAQLAASSTKAGGARYLRLLEPASIPVNPVAPDRQRLLVMVLVLAAVAAGGIVLLLEQADRSFHSVDDVRGFTRVPVLVSIPVMVSQKDARRRSLGRGILAASAFASLVVVAALSFQLAHVNERLIGLLVRSR